MNFHKESTKVDNHGIGREAIVLFGTSKENCASLYKKFNLNLQYKPKEMMTF